MITVCARANLRRGQPKLVRPIPMKPHNCIFDFPSHGCGRFEHPDDFNFGNARLVAYEGGSMAEPFFDHPILNSPYEYPRRHWELDEAGQPTQRVIEQRRSAKFITPIPKPKKRKATAQTGFVFDEGKSLRRNTDKALPASHTIEIMFNLSGGFSRRRHRQRTRYSDEGGRAGARHPACGTRRQGDQWLFPRRAVRGRHGRSAQ